jgi:hypothetical protein
VAKGIGKPTANTYKALASLHEKGAVAAGHGKGRLLYRAVPPEELLAALEWRFVDCRRRAARTLATLAPHPEGDGGVYVLRSTEQVIQRLREMLSRARHVVLLDLPGATAPWIADVVTSPAARGASVIARSDATVDTTGHRVPARDGEPSRLAIAIDASEFLMAAIATGPAGTPRAVNAMWTSSPRIAHGFYSVMVSEFFYASIENGLSDGMSVDELEDTFARFQALRKRAPA